MIREPIIRLQDLVKSYAQGDETRFVLDGASAQVGLGEFLAIQGRSGSGKTTLLNLIAGLDTPDSGQVVVDGMDLGSLSERARTLFRRDHIGFIFQFFNLIPTLTVLENVTLPAELAGAPLEEVVKRAQDLLERVSLRHRQNEPPDQLSGGEQQRVAIARAMIQEAPIILADEPTGNLDRATGQQVLSLLLDLTSEMGKTLVMVTHSREIASSADRVLAIRDGGLVLLDDASGEADQD